MPTSEESSFLEERIAEVVKELREFKIPQIYAPMFNPKLPRKARTLDFAYDDYTPNSCMPCASFQFPNAPYQVQVAEEYEERLRKAQGKELPRESSNVMSYLIEKKDELNKFLDFGRLFVKPWLMPDSRFAMALPPAEFGCNIGADYFLETDEPFKLFVRFFVEALVSREDIVGDDAHFLIWSLNSTSEGNPFTQIVIEDKDYEIKGDPRSVKIFQHYSEMYFSYAESLVGSGYDLSEFGSSLKPYKSPGISTRNVDGSRFRRESSYVVPNDRCSNGLETKNGVFNKLAVVRNGWAKVSTYGFKVSRIGGTGKKLVKRLISILVNGFDKPNVILEQCKDDNANISLLAQRLNNPDEILFRGKAITSVREFLKLTENGGEFRYVDFQGKVREATAIINGLYHKVPFDPLEAAQLKKSKLQALREKIMVKVNQKAVAWKRKLGTMIFKRWRGIMPAPYEQTMARNPYMKLIASFIERTNWGFASVAEKNEWAIATREFLRDEYRGRVSYSLDLSHFETVGTTSRDLLFSLFGTNQRRVDFIHDCGWAILAAMLEPIYLSFLIASGSSVTSICSLLFGAYIHATVISDLALDKYGVFEQFVKALFGQAMWLVYDEALKQHVKLPEPSVPRSEATISFKTRSGATVVCRAGAGSDDQGGWLASQDLSDAQLDSLFKSSRTIRELSARGVLTFATGEFTSFGVHRTRDTIRQDVTALFSKLFLIEHEKNGEAIWFSFYLLARAIPGAESALEFAREKLKRQKGLDVGDLMKFGRLAAAHYIQTITPESGAMNSLIASIYPEESPKGKAISDALAAAGYKEGDSLKVPEKLTRFCLETIVGFIKGKDVEWLQGQLDKAPTQAELYPRFNLQKFLAHANDDLPQIGIGEIQDSFLYEGEQGDLND